MSQHGQYKRLPSRRAIVTDLLYFGKKVPLISAEIEVDVPEVADLKRRTCPRVDWHVILMKAYGMLAAENPELRQLYMPFPWPHVYESRHSICFLAISRRLRGEDADRVFGARFLAPEITSLAELQANYDKYMREPVHTLSRLQIQIGISWLPLLVRRTLEWIVLNLGRQRARHFGTFSMSYHAATGVHGLNLIAPATGIVGYSRISRRGIARLLFCFDHRLMDGMQVYSYGPQLQAILRGPIADELRRMAKAKQPPVAAAA